MNQAFTTGEIAKICSVAPRTVTKWCDAGMLRHYRIPGTKHRRVLRDDLKQFMAQHGMGDLWSTYEAQERFAGQFV
jgi:excisionase family DNA binding protein